MSSRRANVECTHADILEEMSNNPEEFLDMVLRVDIILTMDDYFKERNISRQEIGEILELSPEWVQELMELNIDMFSTEELKEFLAKAGVPFTSLLDQVRFS
jgi:predicted XRE-type DNA-binding protein